MPAPRRPAFGIAFNLPFEEALAYSTKRNIVLPDVYYGELQGRARAQAFSVAGVARADQLKAVFDSLNDVLAGGGTFADWRKKVETGQVPLNLPKHRLDNIFRTNIQGAYGQGRWESQKRNLKTRPYLMYDAINDSRTRPAHRAMDGHVARADDPIWRRWYPPCGYRCRCTVIALTQAEARARGLGNAAPNVQPDDGWDYDIREDSYAGIKEAVKRTRAKAEAKIAAKLDDAVAAADAADPNKWRYVHGSQKGSNEGGIYQAADGSKYYVKFPADPDQARTEVAAAKIYKALGVETVSPEMITINGLVAVASRFRDDLQPATAAQLSKHPEDLARIYLGSAFTGNLDTAGRSFDNLLLTDKGIAIIDTGATLGFGKDGKLLPFSGSAEDLKHLVDMVKSPSTSMLFTPVLDDSKRLKRLAKGLQLITPEWLDAALGQVNIPKARVRELKSALIARRDAILKHI